MLSKVAKAQPTLRSECRAQTRLHYAEPRGGKACVAGLTYERYVSISTSDALVQNYPSERLYLLKIGYDGGNFVRCEATNTQHTKRM